MFNKKPSALILPTSFKQRIEGTATNPNSHPRVIRKSCTKLHSQYTTSCTVKKTKTMQKQSSGVCEIS